MYWNMQKKTLKNGRTRAAADAESTPKQDSEEVMEKIMNPNRSAKVKAAHRNSKNAKHHNCSITQASAHGLRINIFLSILVLEDP